MENRNDIYLRAKAAGMTATRLIEEESKAGKLKLSSTSRTCFAG